MEPDRPIGLEALEIKVYLLGHIRGQLSHIKDGPREGARRLLSHVFFLLFACTVVCNPDMITVVLKVNILVGLLI